MKNNDLSNRGTPVIAIRIEDNVITRDDNTGIKMIDDFMHRISPFLNCKVDSKYAKVLNYICRNTSYTVDLIVDKKYVNDKHLLNILEHLPYNNLIGVSSNNELFSKVMNDEYLYIIDKNLIDATTNLSISKVTKSVISIDKLCRLLNIY